MFLIFIDKSKTHSYLIKCSCYCYIDICIINYVALVLLCECRYSGKPYRIELEFQFNESWPRHHSNDVTVRSKLLVIGMTSWWKCRRNLD